MFSLKRSAATSMLVFTAPPTTRLEILTKTGYYLRAFNTANHTESFLIFSQLSP